jgi:hypothetical protein
MLLAYFTSLALLARPFCLFYHYTIIGTALLGLNLHPAFCAIAPYVGCSCRPKDTGSCGTAAPPATIRFEVALWSVVELP